MSKETMNKEQLFQGVGMIDEEFIAEASEPFTAKKPKRFRRFVPLAAAAALAAIVALPNLSMSVAYAWEKLPVVGTVVKVFVWRDYQFAEENYEADVRTPTVQVERGADVDPAVSGALEQSADAVNASAKELTDEVLATFQEEMEADENLEGVGKVQADYEILTDTDRYFSMRVWSLETGADSYEQNRYYTIEGKLPGDRSGSELLH